MDDGPVLITKDSFNGMELGAEIPSKCYSMNNTHAGGTPALVCEFECSRLDEGLYGRDVVGFWG